MSKKPRYLQRLVRPALVCVDCGGNGFVEDFATMSLAGQCKACGGTGRLPREGCFDRESQPNTEVSHSRPMASVDDTKNL